jgi:hypothetical protein
MATRYFSIGFTYLEYDRERIDYSFRKIEDKDDNVMKFLKDSFNVPQSTPDDDIHSIEEERLDKHGYWDAGDIWVEEFASEEDWRNESLTRSYQMLDNY